MSLSVLSSVLESVPQYQLLRKNLESSQARVKARFLPEGAAFTLATLWRHIETPVLVVVPRPEAARLMYEQLVAWSGDQKSIHHFPETETLPFERLYTEIDMIHQRLATLHALIAAPTSTSRPPMVVTSVVALAQRTLGKEDFSSGVHTLSVNDQVDLSHLLELWQSMGYTVESAVYTPGVVSRRGGILDIFPVGAPLPVRIELFGNQIDSIRIFNPSDQLSHHLVDSIEIIPAHETLPAMTDRDHVESLISTIDLASCEPSQQKRLTEELSQILDGIPVDDLNLYAGFFNRGSLIDYFPTSGLSVMFWPNDIAGVAWETEERIRGLRQAKERRGELPENFPSFHMPWNELENGLTLIDRRMDITLWGTDELTQQHVHALPFSHAPTYIGQLDSFVEEAVELSKQGQSVIVVTSHSKRLSEILSDYGVDTEQSQSLDVVPSPGSLTLLQSDGSNYGDGFALDAQNHRLVVLGDNEIFGVTKQRRTVRRTGVKWEAFISEISPGDHVVHVEHGVGRFIGTGRPSGDTIEGSEYLILQYAQGDKLYVPLEHLDRVTPYVAPNDKSPHLTRLGTQEWSRVKARAERSTREMAGELLALYAGRELIKGHSHAPDTSWQLEVEEAFPFEETPDQVATLADVKRDMEDEKPMDRLVCGDVGYGKTEIALRAAFKSVMDGKQVAVLVPTTVLAQQHYVTFSQRLSPYPTKIEVLSRFRTAKEQRSIVEALADGQVDICIGTHRLIQPDVRFKDLGLVIVDEEQRFGVGHKERLKQIRREVDVLTLTATPIPRTLHMSMAGVRDMSIIETPPEERLPIKTYVSEFSDELIREAILRELDRQGQVYFLHNRVYNIDYMANYIRRIVPEARVCVAHGQMNERDLESAMADFGSREVDVLVCTTIIESGLDIPNVNTLIINRADSFGLSQLYQLRGRVGRSVRRAYSYMLIPATQSLNETAERRLKAMLAATELGAGFRIAMKDLEIRGAGNILGADQSGHIHAVGFDLYVRLLAQAVEDLRARREGREIDASEESGIYYGSPTTTLIPESRVAVDLGIPSSLPTEYIQDLTTRLGMYQRLTKLGNLDSVTRLENELRDRFGPMPLQAQNLMYVMRLKLEAERAGVDSIIREVGRIVLRMRDEIGGARRALEQHLGPWIKLGNTQLHLELDGLADGWQKPLIDTVGQVAQFREQMEQSR